jgi:hypothetical protein
MDENGTGPVNNNVKVRIFTTSRCWRKMPNLSGSDCFGDSSFRAVHFTWKWDRRTDYKPAAPCLAIEIVAGAALPVTLRDVPTVAVRSTLATRSRF